MIAVEKHYDIVVEITAIQAKIKKIVLDDIRAGVPEAETKKKIKKLLDKFSRITKFTDRVMRMTVIASLAQAFKNWYIVTHLAVATTAVKIAKVSEPLMISESKYLKFGYPRIAEYRQKVKSAYTRISDKLAKSEGLIDRRISLRNSAEIEARRQGTLDEIAELRAKKVVLVWCSSHINCSERCAPFQGKLYSLNRTAGTIDGNAYLPLETATEIYQTTKAGKRWRNGLFGFNCRHYLVPYRKDRLPPTDYNAGEMERQRELDFKQRKMEVAIRRKKEQGFLLRGIDYNSAKQRWAEARTMESELRSFCKQNERVFYPERTQIMTEEIANL